MECPYCNYKTGYNIDTNKYEVANEGEFFRLSNEIKMKRDYINRSLVGCPKCDKIFMSID